MRERWRLRFRYSVCSVCEWDYPSIYFCVCMHAFYSHRSLHSERWKKGRKQYFYKCVSAFFRLFLSPSLPLPHLSPTGSRAAVLCGDKIARRRHNSKRPKRERKRRESEGAIESNIRYIASVCLRQIFMRSRIQTNEAIS